MSGKLRSARADASPSHRRSDRRSTSFGGRVRVGSARAARPWSTMHTVAALQRGDTTIGPLAMGGRTITLVARTTALHLGSDERGALHIRSRPALVEVLDEDGRRHVVRIRDIEQVLIVAIAITGVAGACALRIARRRMAHA